MTDPTPDALSQPPDPAEPAVRTSPDDAPEVGDAPSAVEPAPGIEPVEPSEPVEPGPTRLRMRRAPRYLPFGFTGTGLGVVLGIVLATSFSVASDYSTQTILGYFAAIFGLLGATAGLGLAVLIERRHRS